MEEKEILDGLILKDEPEIVTNPYSGKSVELEPLAVAMYDLIKGCELLGDHNTMRTAISMFIDRWPKEYFILLD